MRSSFLRRYWKGGKICPPFPGAGEMADPAREGKGGIENKPCKVKEVSTHITTNYGAYQGEKAWLGIAYEIKSYIADDCTPSVISVFDTV